MRERGPVFIVAAIVAVVGYWILFVVLPRSYGQKPPAAAEAGTPPAATTEAAPPPEKPARKITATLFYVADDGESLQAHQTEVPYAERVSDQARAILEAQIQPAPPLVSAIPGDAKLRAVFVTDRGDAFVDFSSDISAHHPGGSLAELLTVYTIVNAVTVNLPAVTRVQILVEGREVDTLAGHVDLRHPLTKSLQWVAHDSH
jgi:spore germination protein GerM